MENFKRAMALRIVKLIDVIMIALPFAACWYLYYAKHIAVTFNAEYNLLLVALFFVLYIIICRVYDGFLIAIQRISEIICGQALAAIVCDGIMFIVISLLSRHITNILPMLAVLAVQIPLSALWALVAQRGYYKVFKTQATAIIYDERHGMYKLINEYGLNIKYDIKKVINISECLSNPKTLNGIQTVFLSGVHSHDRNTILKYCVDKGIGVFVVPRIGDVILSGAKPIHMFHLPMFQVGRYTAQPENLIFKRAFDIIFSLFLLVITSPLMLATAIAVKVKDGGPVFYKQVRLTKDGRRFFIHKFRSMRVDAENDGVARLSTGDKDDRITSVGKIIRKYRIDELPQLLDILKGDLSIVGPRPERPEIAEQYCKVMPEFALRLQVKAGLTGYAQVYGKYNTTPYDKLRMDLMYIAHMSIIEDLKIILATVKILFISESTEGVSEGSITSMKQSNVAVVKTSTQIDKKMIVK